MPQTDAEWGWFKRTFTRVKNWLFGSKKRAAAAASRRRIALAARRRSAAAAARARAIKARS